MSEYICPHCKQPIYDDDALLCHFCGESLMKGRGVLGSLKYPKPKVIVIAIIGIVLAGFLMLMVF